MKSPIHVWHISSLTTSLIEHPFCLEATEKRLAVLVPSLRRQPLVILGVTLPFCMAISFSTSSTMLGEVNKGRLVLMFDVFFFYFFYTVPF